MTWYLSIVHTGVFMKHTYITVAALVTLLYSGPVRGAEDLGDQLRTILAAGDITAPATATRLLELMDRAVLSGALDVASTVPTICPEVLTRASTTTPGIRKAEEYLRIALREGHANIVIYLLGHGANPTLIAEGECRSPLLDFIM